MTLSSWVPAWVMTSVDPSADQPAPQGLAAPRSGLSSSTVFTTSSFSRSMRVPALVFIQPRSSWVVGSWCRARMCVTTA